MSLKSDNFSFEPINGQDINPSDPIVQAVPSILPAGLETEEDEDPSNTAIMVGCGLIGCIVAGPFLAILTALGGSYAADHNKGPLGESSKAIGRVAAAAGKKANEEHLYCKVKESVASLFKRKTCN